MASVTSSLSTATTQLHYPRKQTISLPTKPSATAATSCETMDRLSPKPTVERGQLGPAPNKPSIATECAVRLDACRARLAMAYRVSISKPSANIPVIRTRHERVKEPDTTPSPRRRACSFFVARPSCLSHVICQPEEMTESRLRLAPRKRSDPDLRIKCLREHTKLIRAQKAKERAEKKALKEKERRRERELEREKRFKSTKKWTPVTVQTTSAAVSAIAFPSITEPEAPAVVTPAPTPAPAPAPAPTPVPTVAVHPAPEEKAPAAQSPASTVASPSSTVTDELDDLSLDWKKEKKQKMMKKKSAEALAKNDSEKEKSGQSLTLEVPAETPIRKRKTSGSAKESSPSQASSSSPILEVPGEAPIRKRKTSGLDKKSPTGTDRERKKSKPKLPSIPSATSTEAPPPLPTNEPPTAPPTSKPDTPKTPEKKCIIIVNRPPCIIVPLPESMPAVMARPDSPTPRK